MPIIVKVCTEIRTWWKRAIVTKTPERRRAFGWGALLLFHLKGSFQVTVVACGTLCCQNQPVAELSNQILDSLTVRAQCMSRQKGFFLTCVYFLYICLLYFSCALLYLCSRLRFVIPKFWILFCGEACEMLMPWINEELNN